MERSGQILKKFAKFHKDASQRYSEYDKNSTSRLSSAMDLVEKSCTGTKQQQKEARNLANTSEETLNYYFLKILCHSKDKGEDFRIQSGFLLRNNLRIYHKKFEDSFKVYIRLQIIPLLNATKKLQAFVKLFDQTLIITEFPLDASFRVVRDVSGKSSEQASRDLFNIHAFYYYCTNFEKYCDYAYFILVTQRLEAYFYHPNKDIRLKALQEFKNSKSHRFVCFLLDKHLANLTKVVNDADPEVRREAIEVFLKTLVHFPVSTELFTPYEKVLYDIITVCKILIHDNISIRFIIN